MAVAARALRLHEMAMSFLELAEEEATEGYRQKDERRVRDAAEKAWLAALQAIDAAMGRHGRVPCPGAMAHQDRHDFLCDSGREDLSDELAVFAEKLHGQVFYYWAVPREDKMCAHLDRVRAFVRTVRRDL